ncbi:MAG: DUF968 domain-containing protein [Planctomycetes bacterium]|nr:DUF968 domain-containing protein [Planctomycetota bacterium]
MAKKNQKYIDWIKTLPCCHTGQYGVQPHHIIGVDKMGTMGGKASDIAAMPLCFATHRQVHDDGGQGWPQTRWLIETLEKAVEAGVIKIGT